MLSNPTGEYQGAIDLHTIAKREITSTIPVRPVRGSHFIRSAVLIP